VASIATYAVRIVERNGTVVRTMDKTSVQRVVDELNGPGEVEFTFPKFDPIDGLGQYAALQTLQREVQILRNGVVIAWGVPLRKSGGSSRADMTVAAPGVAWHFNRRTLDAPITDRLTNSSFENGLTGWTAVNCTATIISSPTRLGGYAVRLTQNVTGADAYLAQAAPALTMGEIPMGHVLAGHYNIETLNGPALDALGLYVNGNSGGNIVGYDSVEIDESAPRGQWERVEAQWSIDPYQTQVVEARLYCPNGSIVWDGIRLVGYDSVDAGYPGKYLTELAGFLVNHVQTATGKDNLFIGQSTPVPGPWVPWKTWPYVDHTPLMTAINDELAPLGFDWSIELGAATKTFTTHVPRKGVDRSATVTLQLGQNLTSYTWEEDGTDVDTHVTMLGDGDGPDREEAIAIDTSALGGLVLQGTHSAPPGTTVNQLDSLAYDKLARKKRMVRLPTVTTYPGATWGVTDLVDLLKTGDVVKVIIDDGGIQVNANYRIIRRELDIRNDTMVLTLNEDFGVRAGWLLPAADRAMWGINRRVQDIERATLQPRRTIVEERPEFSQPDAVTIATSGEHPVRTGGPIVQVEARLTTAGTTATTFKVLRNGVQVGSDITLAAGATSVKAYLGANVAGPGDRLSIQVTAAGAGAKKLVVVPLMKAAG
jgi:hypothetical protein